LLGKEPNISPWPSPLRQINDWEHQLKEHLDKDHKFRDILRHILGEPFPNCAKGEKVGDIMTSPAITTGPEADIREIALTLDEKRIKRLPVVDEQGRLIGVISRADIVRAIGAK